MDLRHYFSASTSKQSSVPTTSSSSSEGDGLLSSDSASLELPQPKKKDFPATEQSRSSEQSRASESTIRSGKKIFLGWSMMKTTKEPSAKFVASGSSILHRRLEGHGFRSPSKIGKRQLRRCVLMPRVMLTVDILKLKC